MSQPVEKPAGPAAEVEIDEEREIDEAIEDLILRGDLSQLPPKLREALIARILKHPCGACRSANVAVP